MSWRGGVGEWAAADVWKVEVKKWTNKNDNKNSNSIKVCMKAQQKSIRHQLIMSGHFLKIQKLNENLQNTNVVKVLNSFRTSHGNIRDPPREH